MTLSHSKMLNSLDLLEPRQSKNNGKFEVYPLFSTNTGWHSTVRSWRKSEIEELGEGANLYFKFLKYFMLLFLLCAGLSGPASAFYAFGFEYVKVPDILNQAVGRMTMGSIGSATDSFCSSGKLTYSRNGCSYI